jgi:DNA polymerase-3 subunit gamma/tau
MSLYNDVRPEVLDDVFGNTATVAALKTYIRQSSTKRNHSLLFVGPTGCGKTTLARIMARAVGADDSYSLIELNAANTKGIDTVRDIDKNARTMPLTGSAKVYLVDESHELTSKAQQAFLKLLEDYPDSVYFFFCTTNPEHLIKTIIGRCAKYTVGPLGRDDMRALLKTTAKKVGFDISDEIVDAVAHFSEGLPRNALVNLEKIKDLDDEEHMVDMLSHGTVSEPDIFDICRILCMDPTKRKLKWKSAINLMYNSGTDSEGIRRAILGGLGQKMKRCKDIEVMKDYVNVVEIFSVNTFYAGKSQLAAFIFKACTY